MALKDCLKSHATLETAKEEKEAHGEIETYHPGFLFGQDTYYVGYIKGISKIYQQTGIDTYSNVGFAKIYSGKPENHPYQLFLHLNDIEHTRTKIKHPQTNGCTENLNLTIQNKFYAVAFRKTLYKSMDQIQADLDAFMDKYNRERTNQGAQLQGTYTGGNFYCENSTLSKSSSQKTTNALIGIFYRGEPVNTNPD